MTGYNKESLRQRILNMDEIEFEAMTCKEIAEKFGVNRESIQGTISGLVNRGQIYEYPYWVGKRKYMRYSRFPGAAKLIMSRPLANTDHLRGQHESSA